MAFLTYAVQDDGVGDAGTWREATRERVLRSMDAALAILHINTAPNMPKNVHQEESLEQLLTVARFHLENNIYPEFDPVYRAGTKGQCPQVLICHYCVLGWSRWKSSEAEATSWWQS